MVDSEGGCLKPSTCSTISSFISRQATYTEYIALWEFLPIRFYLRLGAFSFSFLFPSNPIGPATLIKMNPFLLSAIIYNRGKPIISEGRPDRRHKSRSGAPNASTESPLCLSLNLDGDRDRDTDVHILFP